MKTTWSVDNIKVKDNFYDFYKNDVGVGNFSRHHHN